MTRGLALHRRSRMMWTTAIVLVVASVSLRAHSVATRRLVTAFAQSAVPAPGVDAALDARVKAIATRLRCPVCQGESIQDSPAELSAQMRSVVREQLAGGKSEREVMDYFVQKYGQWILLEPRAEGINLLVYWLPVVFLVVGGGVIWMAVRKWTRPAADAV